MSDAEILDWIDRTRGGMLEPGRPLWPVAPTANDGLATLIPVGSSAGRNPDLPAPTSADTFPTAWPNALWLPSTKRVQYRSTTPLVWLTLTNVHVPGHVDISSSTLPITLTDCVIDSAFGAWDAVKQLFPDTSPVHLERCDLRNTMDNGFLFRTGTVKDCYIHDSFKDAFRFLPGGPKRVTGTLCRRMGLGGPGTHADVIQTSGSASDIVTYRNTFYMPFSGSTHDEGATGTTNVLNYNTDGGNLSDILSVADALIGGGYTVSLCPDPGDTMNGAAIIGSWFAKFGSGAAFARWGSFYPGAQSIGRTSNILIHNCRYLEDGSPVQRTPSGDANGLWDYDKATAPARFKQVCQMLGYTDWNDDPMVVAKTGFHTGTVV